MKVAPAGATTWKFWCPGCDSAHVVNDTWNVDAEAATINPSVLVHGDPSTPTCHSFVTDGRIQFLGDSTHALAGHTVDLPDWPTHCEDCPVD